MPDSSGFLAELKRRKVYRVAAVYATVGVAISLGVPDLFGAFELPAAAARFVIILIAIGFPIAVVFAWAYELKPDESAPANALPDAASRTSGAAIASAVTSVETRKSIVVLPFDNMSPDPGDAYFADGLTEEIIADLSAVRSLRVISRSSAMVLKRASKDIRTIGNELNVGFVLEGSVRKSGSDLRITAQLIDTGTDAHIWAEKYEGKLDDVFGMQERCSRSIVSALKVELDQEDEKRLATNPIDNPVAYDCFLRARHEWGIGSEQSLARALDYLQEGLEIVGDNAQIYAGMALVHFYYVDARAAPARPTLDKAEQFAWKALKLDPQSARSHCLLGLIERHRGTATAAVRHLEQARRIDPSDPETLLWLGWIYSLFLGKPGEARPVAEKFAEVDPMSPLRSIPLIWVDWMEARYESALQRLDESLETFPGFRWPLFFKSQLLGRMGRKLESLEVVDEALREDPLDFVSVLCSLSRSALERDGEAFSSQLTDSVMDTLWNDPECPFWMAGWSALLSRNEETIRWLERAVDRGWINHPLLAHDDPFLENARGEPGFYELMDRIRPVWESFEA